MMNEREERLEVYFTRSHLMAGGVQIQQLANHFLIWGFVRRCGFFEELKTFFA